MKFLLCACTSALLMASGNATTADISPLPFASQAESTQVDRTLYLGVWQRVVSDNTGSTKISLALRGDGTYTKTLDAFLRGRSFHNDEVGTWSADGPVISCSGDGNAPASRHDLRLYQKQP